MPHIAKLSKRFYDRLGEDIANELVDMYNAIDLTYKDELRELNDRNRAMVEARLDQRFAEFQTQMDRRFAEFQTQMDRRFAEFQTQMDQRFAQVDRRFGQLEARFDTFAAGMEARFDTFTAGMEARFEAHKADTDARFAAFELRITQLIADQNDKLAAGLNRQMRWMFISWATLLVAYIGLR